MSICCPPLREIAVVPQPFIDILNNEVSMWDIEKTPFSYDSAFIVHKIKAFWVGSPYQFQSKNEQINNVINWCCKQLGDDYYPTRCFLNLLAPGQTFPVHVDTLNLHLVAKRLHITLQGAEDCDYITYRNIENKWIKSIDQMKYNTLYQLDNINPHSVKNNGKENRINFILDAIREEDLKKQFLDSRSEEQIKIFRNLRSQKDPLC